ncbi:MAG: 2-hydroxyacyl-CoA dehydratase, partial [Deltaproteobacteria bacterium]|nr:2-hydroxyacyl-CoA dehydratase [Deltaproteobacteria bacterium]
SSPPPPTFGKTPADMEAESYRESWRVDHAVQETEGLIAFLESLTGKSLSMARLREVMERSNEQFDYCTKILDLCADAPATLSMGDHMASLIFTQFYRGHELGLDQARRMYEEVKERVRDGVSICREERVRLGHYGVPNWFTPGFYDSFVDGYGATFPFMSYLAITQQWIRRDLTDPLRALASRYVGYTELGLLPPWHAQFFVEWAKKFRLDGVVFQRADSCRLLSGPMLLFIKILEQAGVPTFVISSDFVDARDWDDARIKAQLGGFIETLL